MAKQVPFHIKSGIPFGKTIVVALPAGRDWWTSINDFEVLSQIRESVEYTSPLLLDIRQYMTVSFDGVNTISIDLAIPGSDTRKLTKDGYYDVLMSDVLAVDELAFPILSGPVFRSSVVTSDTEVLTS